MSIALEISMPPLAGFWRVVQFRKCRVTGTGIVPTVGAFQSHRIQTLEHLDRPVRLEFAQPDAERRTHDAATNQKHIDFLVGRLRQSRNAGERGGSKARERGPKHLTAVHREGVVGKFGWQCAALIVFDHVSTLIIALHQILCAAIDYRPPCHNMVKPWPKSFIFDVREI